MFSKKKKSTSNENIIDETIADKSKFVTVGFGTLAVSILLFFILEISTSVKISTQNATLKKGGGAEEKSREILMQIALKGKNVKDLEYKYIKEIMQFMSPKEFQEFKKLALSKGFLIVASSPLTRSSYHADEDFSKMKKLREKQSQCHQLQ